MNKKNYISGMTHGRYFRDYPSAEKAEDAVFSPAVYGEE